MKPLTLLSAVLATASPVAAHHSDAGLDMASLVTFDGTVTEYSWRNPHVYIAVETIDENGESREWALQTSSTITVSRMGWTRDSLSTGDRVTFSAHPAMDGRPYALLDSIEKEGGVSLATAFYGASGEPRLAEPEASASTTTLEGRWIADGSKLFNYPGGFDGFFRAQLSLTESAKAAQAAYDELSVENPESTCVGRPTPAMIVSTSIYPLEFEFFEDQDTIVIRSEFFDEERTVHMDGRGHPQRGERPIAGHSVGRWDGDVLVIDTRNFADHRSPYQIGVPSGNQKHVVERYQLTDDGTAIVAEFMLEDPEYITEPMTHTRELIYSPQLEMSRFDCDPDSSSRFVPR